MNHSLYFLKCPLNCLFPSTGIWAPQEKELLYVWLLINFSTSNGAWHIESGKYLFSEWNEEGSKANQTNKKLLVILSLAYMYSINRKHLPFDQPKYPLNYLKLEAWLGPLHGDPSGRASRGRGHGRLAGQPCPPIRVRGPIDPEGG